MKPETLAVFDLFDKQRRYLIPIFQRGYVWDEQRQWAPLWEDILTEVETFRQRGDEYSKVIRKHFLGAIVLVQAPTVMRQIAAYEVIDGQQRLITLQILLTSLRDIAVEMENQYVASALARLVANPGPLSFEEEVFKVWPTNAYQDDFRRVMESGSAVDLATMYPQERHYRKLIPVRPKLVEAYLYFATVIREYLSKENEEEDVLKDLSHERLESLYETLTRYIQLVTITLDDEDDPQVIFETLNARGEPLEPSDLVRNFFFLYATRRGEDVTKLYDTWWSRFDQASGGDPAFWKQKERQGRLLRSRLDLFLFHYVTCRAVHEVNISHLYQEFRDWWYSTSSERSTEVELESLSRCSEFFRQLWVPDLNSRFGTLAVRLRMLDTTTAYPLLLWIREHQSAVSSEEYEGVLSAIESYLVRRAVCGLTGKNYNRIFLALLSKLNEAGRLSVSLIQSELLSLQGESSVWPTDEMLTTSIQHDPIYRTLGPRKTQMVLVAFEQALRGPKTESVVIPTILSVEHILPQGGSTEVWPYPSSDPALDVDERARLGQRAGLMHTLGNLTLLTQPLNSSVSNGPFAQKKVAIQTNSVLRLNTYFQNLEQWNEEEIRRRSETLGNLAVEIWPR